MFRGELIQFDAPEALFSRPRTRELAEFLGAMNFFDGTIHQSPVGALLRTAVGELVLDPAYTNRIGAMVTATIRPEHVAMRAAAAAAAGQTNEVTGTITRRVFFGGSLAYDVQVNTNTIRVEEMSSRSWKEGDSVALTLAPEHVWIFPDAASGGNTP
jgi:ABC-type Fe3+/spermidine/putrescine transport system ATPase subunit